MKVVALLLVLVLLGSPQLGHAQPYIEGQIGYSSANFSLNEPFNGIVDDHSIAYGVTLGVGFAPRWAAELGWHGYGNFDGRATPCPIGAVCPRPPDARIFSPR
jgi:hypothetical protein